MKRGNLKSIGTPGALPLKNRRHEVFARGRAAGPTHAKASGARPRFDPGSKMHRARSPDAYPSPCGVLARRITRMAGLSLVTLQAPVWHRGCDTASPFYRTNDRPG